MFRAAISNRARFGALNILSLSRRSMLHAGAHVILGLACLGHAHEIVFDSSKAMSETRIPLEDLGEGLPQDWSGFEALVIELRATSPQRFSLKIYSGAEEKFSRVLFHPYAGAWVRAAIPIAMLSAAPATGYDMASVGNRSRLGYYLGLWGHLCRLLP
jgi:hypothetical protein